MQKHVAEIQSEISSLRSEAEKNKLDNQILRQECESLNKFTFTLENERNALKSEAEIAHSKLR